MKKVYKALIIIGLALCAMGLLRVFGLFTHLLPTDKYFLTVFFSGMFACCVGFYLEACFEPINSAYYQYTHKQQKRHMLISSILSLFLLVVALIWL